jgi:hypothetical protein
VNNGLAANPTNRKPDLRDNAMGIFRIVSLSLVLLAIADPLVAAELYGTVYSGGVPAANLSVTVEGRNVETRTDGKGGYSLDLPEGNYILIIRGQRFPVTVSSKGTRQDIRF